MSDVEVGATQTNYYMPVQHVDEDEDEDHLRWKQKYDECFEEPPYKMGRKNISELRHATRILGRRYALTTTSYKYLDIGLNVQSRVPVVEIVIGDNRGNQLILHADTWGKLMENCGAMQRLLEAGKPSYSPLGIRDL
ncbi:hypothetical protein EAI_17465 [Harpegnathos saltator]|uniref:Uncharacterized protein n=1 Tax=Harpegnathos saltator TaxID=610380 RepID=E2BFV2_HARSA|nr:hypothetical protein EAI_17465 [Harpegnathos saltator]